MKLAFSTLGNPDWTFAHTISEAKRLGFQALEIRGIEGKMLAQEMVPFSKANEAETKHLLKEAGIDICGFGTSVAFHDQSKFDSALAEGKGAIDVCSQMGIPQIRVFGNEVPKGEKLEAVAKRVAEGIKQLCDYGRDKKVLVLLEVHGDFNTIEIFNATFAVLGQYPGFGIIWDLAHSDKVYGDDFEPFYACVKPYLRHVHIKDHKRDNGAFSLCHIGEGDIPVKPIIQRLESDGYKGYYTFEWEKKWYPELPEPELAYPRFIEFMKECTNPCFQ